MHTIGSSANDTLWPRRLVSRPSEALELVPRAPSYLPARGPSSSPASSPVVATVEERHTLSCNYYLAAVSCRLQGPTDPPRRAEGPSRAGDPRKSLRLAPPLQLLLAPVPAQQLPQL
eukprot:scaffold182362_cov26-Tisochrysis_lutea.AAC.6